MYKKNFCVWFIRLSNHFYHLVRFTTIYHFNIYIYEIYIYIYIYREREREKEKKKEIERERGIQYSFIYFYNKKRTFTLSRKVKKTSVLVKSISNGFQKLIQSSSEMFLKKLDWRFFPTSIRWPQTDRPLLKACFTLLTRLKEIEKWYDLFICRPHVSLRVLWSKTRTYLGREPSI